MTASDVIAAWAARGTPLDVPGATTTVWQEGEGAPVVCLHGVPSSAFLYRKILPALAGRGRRGIAFDFPGLGLAERPSEFDYSWSGLARWAVAAVDALDLPEFHLVVHDIGGPIGFDVVSRIPDRIASLTVLNTMVRVSTFRRPWVMEPFAHRGIGELYLRTSHPLVLERVLRLTCVASPVPEAEMRAYGQLLKRQDGGRAFLRIMRGFERTEEFERRIVTALAERRFPAQAIWGENDPFLPPDAHGEQVRSVLGVDALVRVKGRHFVQEDAPEPIADHIARISGPDAG